MRKSTAALTSKEDESSLSVSSMVTNSLITLLISAATHELEYHMIHGGSVVSNDRKTSFEVTWDKLMVKASKLEDRVTETPTQTIRKAKGPASRRDQKVPPC